MNETRKRQLSDYPFVWVGLVTVLLITLTGSADAANVIPESILVWLRIVTALLVAAGSWWATQRSTPLSDPRDSEGNPLVVEQGGRVYREQHRPVR